MKKVSKIILALATGLSSLTIGLVNTGHASQIYHDNGDSSLVRLINLNADKLKKDLLITHALGDNDNHKHNSDNVPKDQSVSHKEEIERYPGIEKDISGIENFEDQRNDDRYTTIGGNTRDLGGYPALNGKYYIQKDRIIRSADLNHISKDGIKTLNKLHVHYIVDLRDHPGKSGIKGHPDPGELDNPILKGTDGKYIIDPVYTHHEQNNFDKIMHNEGIMYYYGQPAVTDKHAINSYKRTFHILLKNKTGAVLYHCNLGRDRTGTTTALILSALGVNSRIIYHDYLLTNQYHYLYKNNHSNSVVYQADKLHHFFKTIDKKYGSVADYLHNEIGLNSRDIKRLRKNYLVKKHSDTNQTYMDHHKSHKKINHHNINHNEDNNKQDKQKVISKVNNPIKAFQNSKNII